MINLVIPAAGNATRLRPLSANTSKIMVRVNGKPCLDYIVEQAAKLSDISQIVVVDGAFDDIREYCARRWPDITCVKQKSLDGPRDAIKIGVNQLKKPALPLVVWLGDAIILEDGLDLGSDFLLCKEVKNHSAWCMWDGENFYNKPTTTIKNGLALVGLYSFSDGKKAKFAFNDSNDYDISDALERYGNFATAVTNKWYDIGDLPTYYRTCATLLDMKSRVFNRLQYNHDLGTICKIPDYHNKESIETLKAESSWYKELDYNQLCFVPRVLSKCDTELTLSFESGTLLSDLMLYENLTETTWEYIIDKVFQIKLNYFNHRSTDTNFNESFKENAKIMWVDKVKDRLSPTLKNNKAILGKAQELCSRTYPISGMHGDLHFGNILYNQQTDQFKFVDPRGRYGNHVGKNGDNLYDWAKLAHDLYHGYNAMVNCVKPNESVKNIFLDKLLEYDLPSADILDAGLILLATCIPLHYDDPARQERFTNYVEQYSV